MKSKLSIIYLWLTINLVDFIVTYVGLQRGLAEYGPLASQSISRFGIIPGLILPKMLAIIVLIAIILVSKWWKNAWKVLKIANVVFCVAVLWNIILVII